MSRHKNNQNRARKAKLKQKIKHPVDKQKNHPKKPRQAAPEGAIPEAPLPRMSDFGAVAPVPHPVISDLRLLEQARTRLWQSIPGFQFALPFLTLDETATLACSFGLLGASPKVAHDSLLVFLTELFDWMKGHEYAYCAEPNNKAIFYRFARLEYYNSLIPAAGIRNRLTACALASIDVPLLIKLVEGFVDARRAFYHVEDEKALEAIGTGARTPADTAVATLGVPMAKSEFKKATKESNKVMKEFEKAARALTARLERQLTFDTPGPENSVGELKGSVHEDQGLQTDKGVEGMEAIKPQGNYWSTHLLKDLGIAVDRWIKCLKNQGKSGQRLEWKMAFGQAPGSTT